MIVVIQCAGSKRTDAGMLRTRSGKVVKFVARPDLAPGDGFAYARPDDLSDQKASWRDLLFSYNEGAGDNRLGLLPACELYTPAIYQQLADAIGRKRLFILSAGWGLISANFLTPNYDITFSAAARGTDSYKRRKKHDSYKDFSMLPQDTNEPILFFGGNDYLPHFLALTSQLSAPRIIYHASAATPDVPGCIPVRFETTRRTNWHYSCAEAFLDGSLTGRFQAAGLPDPKITSGRKRKFIPRIDWPRPIRRWKTKRSRSKNVRLTFPDRTNRAAIRLNHHFDQESCACFSTEMSIEDAPVSGANITIHCTLPCPFAHLPTVLSAGDTSRTSPSAIRSLNLA